MPQRSNLHQAVIYYVKRHHAPPDVTVTESKMVHDPASGQDREIDLYMEGNVGDEAVVIAVEVVAHSRPKGAPWIESMVAKHDRLPTSKLVLVSWSGFYAPALRKVASYGGSVVALTPEVLPNARVNSPPFYMEMTPDAERANIVVRNDDGTLSQFADVPVSVQLYGEPDLDAVMCTLKELVNRIFNEEAMGTRFLDTAYQSDDRDSLTHFSFGNDDLDHLNLYVHDGTTFRRFSAFEVIGPVNLVQQTPEFTVMKLGDSTFAMSEFRMAGRNAVWVLTSDGELATVSWRLL